jgi:hypothetical protein
MWLLVTILRRVGPVPHFTDSLDYGAGFHRLFGNCGPVLLRDRVGRDGVGDRSDPGTGGRLNPRGRRYRIARKQLPTSALPHPDCHGTGLRAGGCRPLSTVELATLRGDQRAALADTPALTRVRAPSS